MTRPLLAEVLASLPPEWPDDLQAAIAGAVQTRREKIVVLDDDPTGTQTVHDVPVLTDWSIQTLQAELANPLPICFVLTNSRSFPLPEAQRLNATIGRHLKQAEQTVGKRVVVISRSDSTLRGHFPGEVQALAEALGVDFDAWLLIPFFQEGGRYTIGDTHYVAEGDRLVPAGETEFARDAVFGYGASDLRQWVEEKTQGTIPASTVASVTLDEIRRGGPAQVQARLLALPHGCVCIINAASRGDLEVFTQGLLAAEAQGKRYLYRTAASIVPVRAGIRPRALLTAAEIATSTTGGGLIVVGSHVPRSTTQLEHLLRDPSVTALEVPAEALLSDAQRATTIAQVVQAADTAMQQGRDAVVCTSRQLITGADALGSLSISQQVSEGLVAIMQRLTARPRYILAKGGITSSDLATRGLGVKRAMVLGQILPGVPVWQLGTETRHAGLAYIVFPGNVGGPSALADVVTALRSERT